MTVFLETSEFAIHNHFSTRRCKTSATRNCRYINLKKDLLLQGMLIEKNEENVIASTRLEFTPLLETTYDS
jgi:hypothetical protein